MSDDILSEISRFDGGYKPESGIRPGIDTLPDGDYDFEIVSADLARTQKTMDAILRLGLKANGGAIVEKTYFFNSQEAVNRLGADLCSLGFAAFDKPASFSTELAKAMPSFKGVRFRARKTTDRSAKDGKVYHNLFIAGRVAAPGNGPARTPPPPSQNAPPAASSDGAIPF